MLWIPVTVAAALFQILRTSRQHELRGVLDTTAAGFVRFAYGVPLALLANVIFFGVLGRTLPGIPASFWPTIIAAGISQILGTVALLQAFKMRDFAVGTVYSKTEVLIVALMGAVGFGIALRPGGWIGVILVTVGVLMLAAKGSWRTIIAGSGDPAAWMGLLAAAGFAGAAVGIGAASQSLTGAPAFDRALFTMAILLTTQTLINGAWLVFTDPSQLRRVARAWRPAIWVGLFSLLGSLCWAWGFTLESAVKVRTLGQIELIMAFVIARFTLNEKHQRADYIASALVLIGVVLVTLLG